MTTYYLTINQTAAQNGAFGSVTESSTGIGTADFAFTIGGGTIAGANISRQVAAMALDAFKAYLLGDSKWAGGAAVLPLLP